MTMILMTPNPVVIHTDIEPGAEIASFNMADAQLQGGDTPNFRIVDGKLVVGAEAPDVGVHQITVGAPSGAPQEFVVAVLCPETAAAPAGAAVVDAAAPAEPAPAAEEAPDEV